MYGIEGRSWVVLGDPVGPQEEWAELIWRFREMGDRDLPPIIVPHSELELGNRSLAEEPPVQEVGNPAHCEV